MAWTKRQGVMDDGRGALVRVATDVEAAAVCDRCGKHLVLRGHDELEEAAKDVLREMWRRGDGSLASFRSEDDVVAGFELLMGEAFIGCECERPATQTH